MSPATFSVLAASVLAASCQPMAAHGMTTRGWGWGRWVWGGCGRSYTRLEACDGRGRQHEYVDKPKEMGVRVG